MFAPLTSIPLIGAREVAGQGASSHGSNSGGLGYPTVSFETSYGLDAFVAAKTVPETLPAFALALIPKLPGYRQELQARLPEFQQIWSDAAPSLLGTVVREVGLPFARHELSCTLFVNPRLPSMGTPLAINMLSFLRASAKDIPKLEKPLPSFLFVGIVLHELLHKYVDGILQKRRSRVIEGLDPTLLAGAGNPTLIKAHLHVFALEKMIYEKLTRQVELRAIRAQDETFGPEYKRAWQLVADAGHARALVAELRGFAANGVSNPVRRAP